MPLKYTLCYRLDGASSVNSLYFSCVVLAYGTYFVIKIKIPVFWVCSFLADYINIYINIYL